MNRVTINMEKCKECGYCIRFCPRKIVLKKGKVVNKKGYYFTIVNSISDCIGCGFCATACPEIAIHVEKDV